MKIFKIICSFFLFSFSFALAQTDTSIVPLRNIDSTIVTDVRYATTNNFTGKILYSTNKVYLRKVVAVALSKAQKDFMKNYNLRIKIYDGYRPLSVQKKMWEILPDSRYVANPKNGSRHNRGAAVDITLVDSAGNELDMGTEFDNFTERAHSDYRNLTPLQKKNRILLHSVMKQHGFIPLDTEWWHFDYKGWKNFSILDFPIE
jgi:D-alanyl-D-alanine dipeptidase